MKSLFPFWALAPFVIGSCSDGVLSTSVEIPLEQTEQTTVNESVQGELLLKFAPEMSDILDQLPSSSIQNSTVTRSGVTSVDEVLSILGAYQLERVFPVDERHEERTRQAGLHLWYIVRFDEDMDMNEAVERLSRLGEVSKVQSNFIFHANATDSPVVLKSNAAESSDEDMFTFNDPFTKLQWGLINPGDLFSNPDASALPSADIGCAFAWPLCTGDPSIIVAVFDEGVMYDHPDLADNMWTNASETFGANSDADKNGYAGDRYGYNFVTDSGVLNYKGSALSGHATHVAGTIAAVNNNGVGVCGIAGGDGTPNSGVKIMSCQVIDGNNQATEYAMGRAFKYAADNGAVIAQCSLGLTSAKADPTCGYHPGPATEEEWASTYPLEKEAIDYFRNNAGSPNGVIEGGLVFFASGNEYASMPSFPAAYSGCISVSSLAADYTPSTFTNYGEEVDFSAPGGDSEYHEDPDELKQVSYVLSDVEDGLAPYGEILSTLVVNGEAAYGYYEGTSMACPHASGVAALGLSYAAQLHRHFTAGEFLNLMKSTSHKLEDLWPEKEYKEYECNHNGESTLIRMDLSNYKGKVGVLPDAGQLLQAISTGGSEMIVPNIYVSIQETVTLDLSAYFTSSSTSFRCSIKDRSVASASVDGSLLTVKGLKSGTTVLTLTSGTQTQSVNVTVRSSSSSSGWM